MEAEEPREERRACQRTRGIKTAMTAMTEAVRGGATGDADAEPLSPELVLVDPQLAVLARSRLADHPVDERSQPTEQSDVPAPAASSAPAGLPTAWLPAVWLEQTVDEPPQRSRRALAPLRRVVEAVVVVVVVGLSFGLMLLVPRLLDDTGGPVRSVRDLLAAPEERVSPTRAPGGTNTEQAESSGLPERPAPTGPAPEQSPARPVFVWVPAARASHYRVEFFRRGAKVFEAFPTSPRIALPARWVYRGRRFQLAPGRYSWRVRPGYGSRREKRYGATIVRSTWVLPSS